MGRGVSILPAISVPWPTFAKATVDCAPFRGLQLGIQSMGSMAGMGGGVKG